MVPCRGLHRDDWNGCGEGVGGGGGGGKKGVRVVEGRGCREGKVRLRCGGRQARFW